MVNFHMHPYSKSRIDRAGDSLRNAKPGSKEYQEALEIVNEWRTSHAYPINTFVATLRRKVSKFKKPLVAQRLKRLPTIINKLSRQPEMNLSRMQDIGGVRAVVDSIKEVKELQKQYQDQKRFTHELVGEHDYIDCPKPDGYRSVHLIFKYNNTLARNGMAEKFKGLSVEVQLRTRLQHTWATAVETVGTFHGESYKTDQGEKQWLEFFALVSSAFALVEGTPVADQHKAMTPAEIYKSIKDLAEKLGVLDQLRGLSVAADAIHTRHMGGHYNLIILDKESRTVSLMSWKKDELEQATAEYARREAIADPNLDLVLVSVGDLEKLKLAYPNYFLDVRDFVEKVEIIIEEATK